MDKENMSSCSTLKVNSDSAFRQPSATAQQENLTISKMLSILNCLQEDVLASPSTQPSLSKKKIRKDPKKRVRPFRVSSRPAKGCHCTKTNCLKLYCECFQQGKVCSSLCKCSQCCNTEQEESRVSLMQNILAKQPLAFDRKIDAQTRSHRKGCKCQKSQCQKKYCECFINGVECSTQCQCLGCLNCNQLFRGVSIAETNSSEPSYHIYPTTKMNIIVVSHGDSLSSASPKPNQQPI